MLSKWLNMFSYPSNSIQVIHPYKWNYLWVFDDPSKGLTREPFINCATALIDAGICNLYGKEKLPTFEKGFNLLFSNKEFMNYDFKFIWKEEIAGGNVYECKELNREGWLCPALLKYFRTPPKCIFVKMTLPT